MYNDIKKALEIILKEEYDKENPLQSFTHLDLGNQLLTVPKGETILYQGDSAEYFYILLSGRTIIMNQISFSTSDIIDYVEPPHILGFMEYIDQEPHYTAFVVADTACVLFRVNAKDFMNYIRQNAELCYQTLLITAHVASSNMDRAETHRIFPSKDILGHYLYKQACYHLPYICPLTRKDLANKLNINLRTLYRYLDHMEKQGYIILCKGKIIIKQEQLNQLSLRYGDVII